MKKSVVCALAIAMFGPLVSPIGATAQQSPTEPTATALAGPESWTPVPGERNFVRISTLQVGDGDESDAPEIVTAYANGTRLAFSNSVGGNVGFADISDPANPVLLAPLDIAGEPTAVSALGEYLLIGEVDAASTLVAPDGNLIIVDTADNSIVRTIDLGGQPDSVAVSPDGTFAAVVIENERDEDLAVGGEDGALPQAPAGELIVVDTSDADPANWTTATVDLTGLTGANEPTDPEPEFVDISSANKAVVSLQENNALAIVDLATATVDVSFSAGQVSLPNVDITEDDIIDFDGSIVRERQPDSVSWIGTTMFATANEGDIPHLAGTIGGDDGGSRGFTVFDTTGQVIYESGESFEYAAMAAGHFPLGRAENKGIEPEAIDYATFGDADLLFVGAERANLVGVYDASNPQAPQLRQLLPTGIGPEGLLAIPSRDLLVVANEVDEVFPSSLMIYQLVDGAPTYPELISGEGLTRFPIPFAAQSGLAASPTDASRAYSVQDSFFADSRIFHIDVSTTPATVTGTTALVDGNGDQVSVDLEGVAVDPTTGGWWVASEGGVPNSAPSTANAIHRVAPNGTVTETITLPADRQACWTSSADDLANTGRRNLRFGFEGVTVAPDGTLWVAQQREWADYVGASCTQFNDAAGTTALWRYLPETGAWEQYPYVLDDPSSAGGWVGLSEITAYGNNTFLVVERDNQIGTNAEVKRLYTVTVPSTPGPVVKGDVVDLLPALEATNGIVLDKVEGAMVTLDGDLWISTDNDGVDDHPGESLFRNLGQASTLVDAGRQGYWIATAAGDVSSFGDAGAVSAAGATVVDIAATSDGSGQWVLKANGQISVSGSAASVGSVNVSTLAEGETLVAIVPRLQGDGAWVVTSRGRVIALGAAPLMAGVESLALGGPVVDAALSASGAGLYMAASDGGVFTSGDAAFLGSMGGTALVQPVVAMAADPDGSGYWLFAADGGVFAFSAQFRGSLGGINLASPIAGGTSYGHGYVMAGGDGGVFVFANEPFEGSLGATPPASAVVGIAAFAR